MPEFDKKLCLNNIYYLTKERNIKIGDLETNAKVSTGYFSRLNKEDNKTNPSIDALCLVAEQLSVSIDSLINIDFSALTPDESFVLKFIETLKANISNHRDSWEKDSLHHIIHYDESIPVHHPLLKPKANSYFSNDDELDYESLFYPERPITLIDDVFYLNINCNDTLFLSSTAGLTNDTFMYEESGYELYIKSVKSISTICCAYEKTCPLFFNALTGLYNLIKDATSRTNISSNVRKLMDTYMSHSSDMDDLPF